MLEEGEETEMDQLYKIDHLTLTPEWDLIAKMRPLLQESRFIDWMFSWIAGHQDRKLHYDELTLQAQLNCDADRIAGEYQKRTDNKTPWIVALTPECPVHLDIQGSTVTSKYKSSIRRAISHPPLWAYIARRNEWTPEIMQSID